MVSPTPDPKGTEYWIDVERIFASLCELAEGTRPAALEALCANRPDLRAEVESLLAAQAGATSFLNDSTGSGAGNSDDDDPQRTGERIGLFTLLERIATGGMGAVYRAERAGGDFAQQVAVKLIAAPMGDPDTARRFRAERQILAALHHPHIVALLDGGITPRAEAYLVMEYVDGEPISTYCQRRALSLRARLELFRQVCGAVQYLHQNFVVHRDLKPTNILITADGAPKVLDFGIAKLVEPSSGPAGATVTRPERRALTPNYASPEQLRGLPASVTSDVYALGVLLYELLTGTRPYEATGKPLDETLRLVLETEPARPSAARRGEHAPPYDLRALRADLDAIVLRALRKAPDERYASAAALADDVGRYLAGRPVEAREPSLGYVVRRLAVRHKAAFMSSASALLVIVALLVVSVWQARVARTERDRADARFQDVRRLANSVIYELHDAIANLPGATPARRLLVARALEYLDRLAAEARGDVALKRELADAYQKIAQVQNSGLGANLGDTRTALESYSKALTIRKALAARTPVESQDVFGLALLEFDLGTLQRVEGQAERAEQSFVSAAARLEELSATGALHDGERIRLAGIYQRLAEAQAFQGKSDAAIRSAEKAVAAADAALRAQPQDRAARSVLAAASYQLSESFAGRDRYREAIEWTVRARTVLEAALRENPLESQETRILLYALNGEGRYLAQLGDLPGAVAVSEHALDVAEQASRRDPEDRWSRMAVAVAAGALGEALLNVGHGRESERRFRQALNIADRAVAEDPQNSYSRLQAASAQYGLGRTLVSQPTSGARTEGCALLHRVQTFWADLQTRRELPANELADLGTLHRFLERCPSAS